MRLKLIPADKNSRLGFGGFGFDVKPGGARDVQEEVEDADILPAELNTVEPWDGEKKIHLAKVLQSLFLTLSSESFVHPDLEVTFDVP